MKKPANAGAHGLSIDVFCQVDSNGYAPNYGALQVQRLVQRGLTPATAAAIAALAYPTVDSWQARA